MRLKPVIVACVLAALYYFPTVIVGVHMLAPDVVSLEETAFLRQAETIRRGNTPLFFNGRDQYIDRDLWLQPLGVYLTALALPLREPHPGPHAAAVAGAANIFLVFLIAHTIAGTWAGLAAAVALMVSDGHWRAIAAGTDAIYPATLVLAWLWGVVTFAKRDSLLALCGASLALGICVYAHRTGPLTAAFLWAFTLAFMWRRNRARLAMATLVFIAMWMPAAAWFYLHPDTYGDTFGRWVILKAHIRSPLDLFNAFMNPNTLGQRSSFYWSFWDPSWMLLGVEARRPLVWLATPFIVLAVFRARHISRQVMTIVIVAALIVPLAGATFGRPHYFEDAVAVWPLLAILAGLGVDQLVAVLTRRKPLEDDVAMVAVDGWDGHEAAPRG